VPFSPRHPFFSFPSQCETNFLLLCHAMTTAGGVMNLHIRMKFFVAAIFICAELTIIARPSRAEEECLSKPNAAPPPGSHWYYRVDRSQRQCWYLGAERAAKVRGHQQQTTSSLRLSFAPEPEAAPAPQRSITPAAAPVTTPAANPPAEANPTVGSSVETSGWSRPAVTSGGLLLATERPDEHPTTEIADATLAAAPIAAASEEATAEQPAEFEIRFVHLLTILVAVLALAGIIGRTIFSLSRILKPGRIKPCDRSNKVAATTRQAGRTAKPAVPKSSAAVAEIEQKVRRLLQELQQQQRQRYRSDFELPAADLETRMEPPLAEQLARLEAAWINAYGPHERSRTYQEV
jgi:hypothetical protein